MNERILELADEARIKFSSHWAHEGVDTAVITKRDLKEFAELIVRECEKSIRAEIAVTDISGEVEKAWEMGMECGVYTIKKHFGVEE